MTDQTRKGKGKKKFSVSTLLLILMFTLGIGLLLYPPLAQAWNRKNATRMVASYETSVEEMDNSALAQLRSAAIRYNRTCRIELISSVTSMNSPKNIRIC